jgi:hypothetical protein
MERSGLSFDQFNWDNCSQYMNRDMNVEVYLCINDKLYWVIVNIQHFIYEIKRITPNGGLILLKDIITSNPSPHHPANIRGFKRVKYYLSYNPATKAIHFRRIYKKKCDMVNLMIDDEELIAKIPEYIYELTRNTTSEEYLKYKPIFQSLVDEYYTNNMRFYYSMGEKAMDEMVDIIQYYNDHQEEGWKNAVHAVTGISMAEEIDKYEMPCMPAGVSLTPANYLRMFR